MSAELCIGCDLCIPYCPVGAITVKQHKAEVDLDLCVECGVCRRVEICPTKAFRMQKLEYPRALRQYFSDPTITKKESGVPGRGTEEVKTNDVTGRIMEGEIGFCVEMGRPGISTTFADVQKITQRLANLNLSYEEKNPVRALIADLYSGSLKNEILHERVLSIIIEFKVKEEDAPKVLQVLRFAEHEISTVFSVGVISKFAGDGTVPILSELERMGIEVRPNAKVNVGMGSPKRG